MTIRVQYFASVRETLDSEGENLELPAGVDSVEKLIAHLSARHGERWRRTLQESPVLVAINQDMARKSSPVADGDEVAFFPPVTGG